MMLRSLCLLWIPRAYFLDRRSALLFLLTIGLLSGCCKRFRERPMSCKVCFSSYYRLDSTNWAASNSIWQGAPVTPDQLPVYLSWIWILSLNHWMILTTCIPVGATHHFLFMILMNFMASPRRVESLAGTVFGRGACLSIQGFQHHSGWVKHNTLLSGWN